MRRWTLQDGLWQCMDSGDFAEERAFGLRRPVARSSHAPVAAHANEAAGDVHEAAAAMRGQTMVEYALIIAAIGVVAWGAFHLTGRDISSMASGIDSSLTNTWGNQFRSGSRSLAPNWRSHSKMKAQSNTEVQILNVSELFEYLHIHKTTIYRMLREGRLPGFRIGSDWRFSVEAIEQWQSDQSQKKTGP
jgi:excisionase family DNA binding protein